MLKALIVSIGILGVGATQLDKSTSPIGTGPQKGAAGAPSHGKTAPVSPKKGTAGAGNKK